MLLSASFVAFLSIISIGSTEDEEETFDYDSLKEVGSLEPPFCAIGGVHIDYDYIYVFCEIRSSSSLIAEPHEYIHYRVYQKQKPFDLISLILPFDINVKYLYFGVVSRHSEVSNCFYIYGGSGPNIWKVGIDDHAVTTFLSIDFFINSLAISSNGDLYILTSSDPLRLLIYAPDATLIDNIELPFLKESPSINPFWESLLSIIHVVDNKIFMANSELHVHVHESWIRFWSISKLKDGMDEGRFIWKHVKQRQKRLVINPRHTMSQGTSYFYPTYSEYSKMESEYLEETKNKEGMPAYFDPHSNATKNVSKDDFLGVLEMSDYMLPSYFDFDRNLVLVCKDRSEILKYCEGKTSDGFYSCAIGTTHLPLEMILMYKCFDQTSWCRKTLEFVEGINRYLFRGLDRGCRVYAELHKSEGNLFIKPMPSDPKTLMIYTVK